MTDFFAAAGKKTFLFFFGKWHFDPFSSRRCVRKLRKNSFYPGNFSIKVTRGPHFHIRHLHNGVCEVEKGTDAMRHHHVWGKDMEI